jgi:pimeloyl-ACP methyl ester carboxylesterase
MRVRRWLKRVGIGVVALVAFGLATERLLEIRDAHLFPPPGRMVAIGSGRALHLLCKGAGGPSIVVEQGAAEPAILWRSVQDKAAAFSRICLYDRAGYGWSPPAPAFQSIDERADDLHRALHAAGLPSPYILVAHSYGGLVAHAFARRHADDTAGMVMTDAIEESIAFHPVYLDFIAKSRTLLPVVRVAAALGVVRLVATLVGDERKPGLPDPASQAAARAQSVRPAFYTALLGDLRSIEEASRRYPLPRGLGPLPNIPLLVITHGRPFPGPFAPLEPIWLPGQKRQAALSPRGSLEVARNSNHMIAMDEPDLVVDALRRMAEAVRPPPHR